MTSGSSFAWIRRVSKLRKNFVGDPVYPATIYYEVWNGTNNHMLTKQFFWTPRAAREWARDHGYTVRNDAEISGRD